MEQKEVNANSSSPNPAEEEGDHTFRQSSWVSSVISRADLVEGRPLGCHPAFEDPSPLPSPQASRFQSCSEASLLSPAQVIRESTGIDEKAYLLKVPHQLRQVNESAYEPQLISIGPYFHDAKPHLKEMEVYKDRCLQRILKRKGEQSVDRYVEAMNLERAREWYSPSTSLDVPNVYQNFKAMMLFDGCFIVELLSGKIPGDDPIFKLKCVRSALFHDFLLLENQLPFFVLVGLYREIKDPSDENDFACQAFSVLSKLLPGPKKWKKNPRTIKDTNNIKHLLSLLHDNWSPSPQGIKRHGEYRGTKKEQAKVGKEAREEGELEKWKFTLCAIKKSQKKKCLGDEESGVTQGADHNSFKWKFICCAREKKNVRKGRVEWQSLRCATELEEAGIQFMNSTEESNVKSLFDISFTDATMKIPTFMVQDYTERLFRSLIAYEQYIEGSTYVIDYVTLMDNLIDSAKDVQLLRFSGIIENMLGDDEAVAQMINKLRDHVTLCGNSFSYEEIFVNVKKHCARPWNTWKAKLRHDYFNNPWALVSFIAAVLVILLTIRQFITAVIPLVK